MRITMTTLYASPTRVVQPGQTAEFGADEAAALVAGGYAVQADAAPAPPMPGEPPTALDRMTVAQLREYADERDISLPDDAKKADLVDAIRSAEQEQAGG